MGIANEPLQPNEILLSKYNIRFGESISNYFRKKNINRLMVIVDYKNSNMIFWAHEKYGLHLQDNSPRVKGLSILTKITRFVGLPDDLGYKVARQAYKFIGKRLNENAVIIENVPLKKDFVIFGSRVYSNMKSNYIILGVFGMDDGITFDYTQNDLTLKSQQENISATTINKPTTTPLQTKTQSTMTPSQPKPSAKPILDKDMGIYDHPESPPGNSTTQEELDRVNREYSKMILGE